MTLLRIGSLALLLATISLGLQGCGALQGCPGHTTICRMM